jgi:hypothetical protein
VELYIDRGKDTGEENKQILEVLLASKALVEERFGKPLEWDSVEGRRSCRVVGPNVEGGYRDDDWSETHGALIGDMVRLAGALKPIIAKLEV